MSKLIVNADDFGYCEAVNYGIISAHRNGIVTSTTIMANMPGFDHAVNLLKENKDIGCGVHMTLSCNKPLNNKFKSLVDENGMFHRRINEEVVNKIDLDELYYEFCSQIDRVKNAGVEISHLDSHHHVHTIPHFKDVIKSIMDKYNLKIRGGLDHKFDYKERVIPCIDSFYDKNVDVEFFNNNIEEIKSYDVCDLMTHPAFIDNYLLNSTSYAINRAKEYEILTNKKIKKILNENEIVLNAHKIQTKLIQGESAGDKTEISMLLIHSQDHLMTCMSEKNLIREIIELRKELKNKN